MRRRSFFTTTSIHSLLQKGFSGCKIEKFPPSFYYSKVADRVASLGKEGSPGKIFWRETVWNTYNIPGLWVGFQLATFLSAEALLSLGPFPTCRLTSVFLSKHWIVEQKPTYDTETATLDRRNISEVTDLCLLPRAELDTENQKNQTEL